jgi:isoquinoline 1-oxidoreductase alpha subunit
MSFTLSVNGASRQVDLPEDVPLLWALRDGLAMTGTKFGCGVAACGACTVLIDGQAVRSCQVLLGEATGEITTIEGLGQPGALAPLQEAWVKHQVAQCGYCQSGQIMQAAALLAQVPEPTDQDIDDAMQGNLCRCGTYPRIRAAILDAAQTMKAG